MFRRINYEIEQAFLLEVVIIEVFYKVDRN